MFHKQYYQMCVCVCVGVVNACMWFANRIQPTFLCWFQSPVWNEREEKLALNRAKQKKVGVKEIPKIVLHTIWSNTISTNTEVFCVNCNFILIVFWLNFPFPLSGVLNVHWPEMKSHRMLFDLYAIETWLRLRRRINYGGWVIDMLPLWKGLKLH